MSVPVGVGLPTEGSPEDMGQALHDLLEAVPELGGMLPMAWGLVTEAGGDAREAIRRGVGLVTVEHWAKTADDFAALNDNEQRGQWANMHPARRVALIQGGYGGPPEVSKPSLFGRIASATIGGVADVVGDVATMTASNVGQGLHAIGVVGEQVARGGRALHELGFDDLITPGRSLGALIAGDQPGIVQSQQASLLEARALATEALGRPVSNEEVMAALGGDPDADPIVARIAGETVTFGRGGIGGGLADVLGAFERTATGSDYFAVEARNRALDRLDGDFERYGVALRMARAAEGTPFSGTLDVAGVFGSETAGQLEKILQTMAAERHAPGTTEHGAEVARLRAIWDNDETLRQAVEDLRGGFYTIGRDMAAGLPLPHGGAAYSLVSGTLDGIVAIKADPFLALGGAYRKARAARVGLTSGVDLDRVVTIGGRAVGDFDGAVEDLYGEFLDARRLSDEFLDAPLASTVPDARDRLIAGYSRMYGKPMWPTPTSRPVVDPQPSLAVRTPRVLLRAMAADQVKVYRQQWEAADEIAKRVSAIATATTPEAAAEHWGELRRKFPGILQSTHSLFEHDARLRAVRQGQGLTDAADVMDWARGPGRAMVLEGKFQGQWRPQIELPRLTPAVEARAAARRRWEEVVDWADPDQVAAQFHRLDEINREMGLDEYADVADTVEGAVRVQRQTNRAAFADPLRSAAKAMGAVFTHIPKGSAIALAGPGAAEQFQKLAALGITAGLGRQVQDAWTAQFMRGIAGQLDGEPLTAASIASRRLAVHGMLRQLFEVAGVTRMTDGGSFADFFLRTLDDGPQLYTAAGDVGQGVGRATLPEAHQALMMRLPDPAEFFAQAQKVAFTGSVWAGMNQGFFDAFMSKGWKPFTILRPGFIFRAGGEEALMTILRFSASRYLRAQVTAVAAGAPDDLLPPFSMAAWMGRRLVDRRHRLMLEDLRSSGRIDRALTETIERARRELPGGADSVEQFLQTFGTFDDALLGSAAVSAELASGDHFLIEFAERASQMVRDVALRYTSPTALARYRLAAEHPVVQRALAEEVSGLHAADRSALDEIDSSGRQLSVRTGDGKILQFRAKPRSFDRFEMSSGDPVADVRAHSLYAWRTSELRRDFAGQVVLREMASHLNEDQLLRLTNALASAGDGSLFDVLRVSADEGLGIVSDLPPVVTRDIEMLGRIDPSALDAGDFQALAEVAHHFQRAVNTLPPEAREAIDHMVRRGRNAPTPGVEHQMAVQLREIADGELSEMHREFLLRLSKLYTDDGTPFKRASDVVDRILAAPDSDAAKVTQALLDMDTDLATALLSATDIGPIYRNADELATHTRRAVFRELMTPKGQGYVSTFDAGLVTRRGRVYAPLSANRERRYVIGLDPEVADMLTVEGLDAVEDMFAVALDRLGLARPEFPAGIGPFDDITDELLDALDPVDREAVEMLGRLYDELTSYEPDELNEIVFRGLQGETPGTQVPLGGTSTTDYYAARRARDAIAQAMEESGYVSSFGATPRLGFIDIPPFSDTVTQGNKALLYRDGLLADENSPLRLGSAMRADFTFEQYLDDLVEVDPSIPVDQILHQVTLEDSVDSIARDVVGTADALLRDESGNPLLEVLHRVNDGDFGFEDVSRIGLERLPRAVSGPELMTYDPSLFEKVIRFGFDEVVGPAIHSMARSPFFFDEFDRAFDETMRVASGIAFNPEHRRVVTDLGAEIGLDFEGTLMMLRGMGIDRILAEADKVMVLEGEVGKRAYAAFARHGLRRNQIRDLATMLEDPDVGRAVRDAMAGMEMGLNEIVEIAGIRAVGNVVPFIDDHRIRSQFQVWANNFVPFWFAEEQFLRRWSRTARFSPEAFRRAQLYMGALRNVGLIREDTNGQEIFVIPLAPGITEVVLRATKMDKLFGTDAFRGGLAVPFTGRTDGVFAGVGGERVGIPQLGPYGAVAINAAARMLPELDPLRDAVLGEVASDASIFEQFVPSHWRSVLAAAMPHTFGREQLLSNEIAAAQMMLAEASRLEREADEAAADGKGGKAEKLRRQARIYAAPDDMDSLEWEEWRDEVRRYARALMVTQAVLHVAGPTKPTPQFPGYELSRRYAELIASPDLTIAEALGRFLAENPDARPWTIFATEKPSGAPLPATEQALEFMDSNEEFLRNFPAAGPWFITSSDADSPYSRRAYHQQMAWELRRRKGFDDWYKDLKYAEAAEDYFDGQTRKEIALAETLDPAARATIRDAWSAWSKNYRAQHPLFAEMLEQGIDTARRTNALNQMRLALADDAAPGGPHAEALAEMVQSYDTFRDAFDTLKLSDTDAAVAARAQLKRSFYDWGQAYVGAHPTVKTFWLTMIMPLADLNKTSTLAEAGL